MKNFKNKIGLALLLFLGVFSQGTIINAETEPEIIDTPWVYDETNSLSEETIEFINNLNNVIDNQYAVYITDTIEGNMDSYKLKLFNELGVGDTISNSGILFVLATEDKSYGIEIGDGFSGPLREAFETDFVSEVAIVELRAGAWDRAVYKVSERVAKNIITITPSGSTESTQITEDKIIETTNKLMGIVGAAILGFIVISIIGATVSERRQRTKLFRTQAYKDYITTNGFNKRKIKKEFKNYYNCRSTNDVYRHMTVSVGDIIKNNYNMKNITLGNIKHYYPIEKYEKNKTVKNTEIAKIVVDKIKAYRKKKSLNENWLAQLIREKDIRDQSIINYVKKSFNNLDKLFEKKYTMEDWLLRELRKAELASELQKEFSNSEVKSIMSSLKGKDEYERYISGKDKTFSPTKNERNSGYYNKVESNSSFVNSPLFWLMVYGHNQRRIQREVDRRLYEKTQRDAEIRREIEAKERAQKKAEEQRSINSQSYSSFGSGFGGGSSSGGGFSGGF